MVNIAGSTLEQGPESLVDWFKIFLMEQATDFPNRTYVITEGVCVCVWQSQFSR